MVSGSGTAPGAVAARDGTSGHDSDIDVLESVLVKDEALLAGVRPGQSGLPTGCPDYDVGRLVNHIVGWARVFAAAANGRTFDGDPTDFVSDDPVRDFHAIATDLISGWRAGGLDRTVRLTGPETPAQTVLAMTLMEFVTHGCDLALATGQPVPFTETELGVALDRARATLAPQFRGEGKPFGDEIAVRGDAPVLDRFLGFMGRRC